MNMAISEASGTPERLPSRLLFLAASVPAGTPGKSDRPPHRTSHETALNTLKTGLGIFLSPEFRKTGTVSDSISTRIPDPAPGKLPEILAAPSGKPYFRDPALPFFSWAHSGPLVFLGIADVPLGTDAEIVASGRNLRGISERFFSEKEQRYLNEDSAAFPERFFELWTLREAAGKYEGSGIQGFRNIEIDPESRRTTINGTPLTAWSGSIAFRNRVWYLGAALAASDSENTVPELSPPLIFLPPENPEQNPPEPPRISWNVWTRQSRGCSCLAD